MLKIFFQFFEKKQKGDNQIKTCEGSVTEDSKLILRVWETFTNLYSSCAYAPARLSNVLNSESLRRLDNVKQGLYDGLNTEEECLSALKTFQRNKTLGTDGL